MIGQAAGGGGVQRLRPKGRAVLCVLPGGFIGCINRVEPPGLPCWECFMTPLPASEEMKQGGGGGWVEETGTSAWDESPSSHRQWSRCKTGSLDVHTQPISCSPTQNPSAQSQKLEGRQKERRVCVGNFKLTPSLAASVPSETGNLFLPSSVSPPAAKGLVP